MAASYLPSWATSSWTGPRVRFTLPPASYFKFPPSSIPTVLPPPPNEPSLAHPFTIPVEIYNALLSPNVPITVALVYATAITYLNGVNARRNFKPWAISKTRLFTVGVLLHNLFLALYSAWTCVGMVNALRLSFSHWSGEYGLAGAVDSLCKLHGPRGMSSAATFNPEKAEWGIYNTAYHLSSKFLPEATDVGRIWNEGLAFYGWLFYISKFYEVIDTLIIIAKGKKSSFLQTYHHAGAMMCMWAGIRYMCQPIWMFVMVNSFIHTIMYTFYFFTALHVRVPKPLKQILTTMQITQFLVGLSFAILHLFIEYQVPVKTPYIVHIGQQIVDGASALGADAASQFTSVLAAATAAADAESWLKKFALRAAGREGLAENVVNRRGQTFGIDAAHSVSDLVKREEVRYRDEFRWTHCLDTSGQTFGIYLNILYLLPLTWLFAQFFVNSYLKRAEVQRRRSLSERVSLAGQSFGDARRGVGRRLSEAFENTQGWNGDTDGEKPVVIDGQKVRAELKKLDAALRDKANEAAARVPTLGDIKDSIKDASQKAAVKVDEVAVETPKAEEWTEVVREGSKKANKKASQAVTETQKAAEQVKKETAELVQSTSEQISASTGMDLDDVLKRAWASVDSPKGKSTSSSSSQHQAASSSSQHATVSSSSTSQQTSSSTTTSAVSSTTIFESSSISRSSQDEVIGSSQVIRDEDINTKTGEVKKEALQDTHLSAPADLFESPSPVNASPHSEQLTLTGGATQDDLQRGTIRARDESSHSSTMLSREFHGDQFRSGLRTPDGRVGLESPVLTSSTTSSSSSSSFSEEDPVDEFSQTRPASSSAHASPVKKPLNLSQHPIPIETIDVSSGFARRLFQRTEEPGSGHFTRSQSDARSKSIERYRQRSMSPSKIPVLTRSATTGTTSNISNPTSGNHLNLGAVAGTSMIKSKSTSSAASSTSTSTSTTSSESALASASASTEALRAAQSPKWHARRRGQQTEDHNGGDGASDGNTKDTRVHRSSAITVADNNKSEHGSEREARASATSSQSSLPRPSQGLSETSSGGAVGVGAGAGVGSATVSSRSYLQRHERSMNNPGRIALSSVLQHQQPPHQPQPPQGSKLQDQQSQDQTWQDQNIQDPELQDENENEVKTNTKEQKSELSSPLLPSSSPLVDEANITDKQKSSTHDDNNDNHNENPDDAHGNRDNDDDDDDDDNDDSHQREPRRKFNQQRDKIEDVTSQKGDDDSLLL